MRKAYWARVTNSCGTADSDIAVIVPHPGPPSNVNADATGAAVTVTWSAGSGAEKYQIWRKVKDQAWTKAGEVLAPVLTFTETPSAPGGMVVYRVLSAAGAAYLSSESLATSSASNNDFANLNTGSYEQLATPPGSTTIKAQHLIELRQAVNALCDAVGVSEQYQSGDLQLSALQGTTIKATDFTSLMTHINNIRTDAAVAAGAAMFATVPAANALIRVEHLRNLRDALK